MLIRKPKEIRIPTHCPTCGAGLPPSHPLRKRARKNDGTKPQIFKKPTRKA